MTVGYVIDTVIADRGSASVGMTVFGRGQVDLTGDLPNTFTGDVYVSNLAGLQVYKRNGAVAIRGNVVVSDGGVLILSGSNQISDSSIIRLDGRERLVELKFGRLYNSHVSEKVSRLQVAGDGLLFFEPWPGLDHGEHYLYLDDLEIEWGGQLTVRGWELSHDHLLVRKDSEHLNEALSRIKFEGYTEWRADVKEYNKDYWQLIPGIPEPSTYGAALGTLSLALFVLRRRKREGCFSSRGARRVG